MLLCPFFIAQEFLLLDSVVKINPEFGANSLEDEVVAATIANTVFWTEESKFHSSAHFL